MTSIKAFELSMIYPHILLNAGFETGSPFFPQITNFFMCDITSGGKHCLKKSSDHASSPIHFSALPV